MSPSVERVVEQLQDAHEDLAGEVEQQQRRWRYRLRRGQIWFDKETRDIHRRLKQSLPSYIREGSVLSLLTAPVVYSLLLPFVVLDVWVTVYQWVCFPIYGVTPVRRRAYFVLDRHKLSYLNGIEKINCTFCSYANGLIAYVREVAARTEQYWCPIKHARAIGAPHVRYHLFFDYGDALSYRRELATLRRELRHELTHGAQSQGKRRHGQRRDCKGASLSVRRSSRLTTIHRRSSALLAI